MDQKITLKDIVDSLVIHLKELGYDAQRIQSNYPIWLDVKMSSYIAQFSIYNEWIDCYYERYHNGSLIWPGTSNKQIDLCDPNMLIKIVEAINEPGTNNR